METMNFREGDIVEYAGLRGIVVNDKADAKLSDYPVVVSIFNQDDRHELFTLDGRLDVRDKCATLELIERPRKLEVI
jgi:hypothetical protein